MKFLKQAIIKVLNLAGYSLVKLDSRTSKDGENSATKNFPPDFPDEAISTILEVQPYTMTSPERILALIQAVEYVENNKIDGDIVECGVWKGGSMLAAARTLTRSGDQKRHLYLFDTFDGMTAPTEEDVDWTGSSAEFLLEKDEKDEESRIWCYAPFESVRKTMEESGYDKDKIHLIKGKVEETIPLYAPKRIAILRLDTDWYESTKHELTYLFPRLSVGGVIIIDDYGWWKGARLATDEYVQENNLNILLNRIDQTGRIGIKLA
jgi:hypothetical protein